MGLFPSTSNAAGAFFFNEFYNDIKSFYDFFILGGAFLTTYEVKISGSFQDWGVEICTYSLRFSGLIL